MNNISNVFVVDDDAAVRDSLRMLLKTAGYTAATFASADEFLTICNSEIDGCLILDVNMPDMDGPALQEELNRRRLQLPIIFLTGQGSIPLSVRTLKAGAMDFLTKPVEGRQLLACVAEALNKCAQLRMQKQESRSTAALLENVTSREKEVMLLVIQGLTSKEIAEKLSISYRTVENYRANIKQKTGSKNIIDLARIASVKA